MKGGKKGVLRWGLTLLTLLGIYAFWAYTGRAREKEFGWKEAPQPKFRIETIQVGAPTGQALLIALQPYMSTYSYATRFNFETTLRLYFNQLRNEGLLDTATVVVLPEYIGTWLVAAGEKEAVYSAATITDAMRTMVFSNLFSFAWNYLRAKGSDKVADALFRMKSTHMARVYAAVFSELAKEYQCTIVAGSIVLPDAYVDMDGSLRIRKGGPLYNTTAVFYPNGLPDTQLVKKQFPITEELGFTACAKPGAVPVFATAAGRMAVLICADSWYPAAYAPLQGRADFLVVPSLAGTDSVWQAPWQGYNGAPPPADVDTGLYRRISEGEAWQRYSMGTRAPQAGVHQGVNVFFTGDLWDLHPQGRVLLLQNDSLRVLPPAKGKGRIVRMPLQVPLQTN
ncbi:MAG: carbon-nitrogen hydrolase family protein [Lacibacter sp.]